MKIKKNIILAEPRGFCAGVKSSLKAVEKALKDFGPPIYVKHEIVHNKSVLKDLSRKGVVFAENIYDIPEGSTFVISAHGVSPDVQGKAKEKRFKIVDATCPVVKKIHKMASELSGRGYKIILIGHKNHPEIIGITGYIGGEYHTVEKRGDLKKVSFGKSDRIAIITQTTLNFDDTIELIDEIKEKFPGVEPRSNSNICYATRDRQDAVRRISEKADLVLIIGSANSSNSNRLRETALKKCPKSFLIENKDEVTDKMLSGALTIGISAGASAPEYLVEELIEMLKSKGYE